MSKKELKLELGEMYAIFEKDSHNQLCRFGLDVDHPPSLWAFVDGEHVEAFIVDVDHDWKGVNDYNYDDYEVEIERFADEVDKYVRQLFIEKMLELVDSGEIRITNVNDEVLDEKTLPEYISWQDKTISNHYDGVVIGNEKHTPRLQRLCVSPIRGTHHDLVIEYCNVTLLSERAVEA